MVTAALLVTVAMTAAYATRAYLIVARPRTVPGAEAGPAPRTGLLARATLVALAVATLAGGLVFLVSPLDPGHLDLPLLGVSVVLIATGVLVGLRLRPDDAADPAPLMTRASRGWGADAAYVGGVAQPVLALARAVTYVDREIIESYVRAPGWVVSLGGRAGVRGHAPERVSTDLLWVVLGLLVMAGVALWG